MEKTLEKTITKEKLFNNPQTFNIRILNNQFSTFEFVILVLTKVYKMSTQDAFSLALKVHEKGSAICLENKPKSLCELVLDKTLKFITHSATNENDKLLYSCFKIEPAEEQ